MLKKGMNKGPLGSLSDEQKGLIYIFSYGSELADIFFSSDKEKHETFIAKTAAICTFVTVLFGDVPGEEYKEDRDYYLASAVSALANLLFAYYKLDKKKIEKALQDVYNKLAIS
jgi:hypothetical protein